MNTILQRIRTELRENADEDTKNTSQRFFKEKVKCYGIKTAIVTKISKKYFDAIKDKNKSEIFRLSEELFQSGYIEESFIACNLSYNLHAQSEEKDFLMFERWIEKYVNNWASCDTLCNHTVGAFIEKFPKYINNLEKWAKSDNYWMRRAAAVSLIIPAKKGKFLKEAFEISNLLIADKEDLVRKGYGWLLKEESRTHQNEVFEYVMENKHKMPRTALRYAIELMPKELKIKAMQK
ncbi:MAG: DNA alkylation repair protein [Candidatus Methanoperedens sp.]|nr:DNA alkylation repair protein [Candidatus Methanoperedens sp.]